jgi:hypothetical protein
VIGVIFGHLGLAFLFKAKFYSKSFMLLVVFCYLPDLFYYLFFGIQWVLVIDYPPILSGVLRPLLSITGFSLSFIDYPIPLSHSIALYLIFSSIFLLVFFIHKRSLGGLIFTGALFTHLLADFLLPDATIGVPIVYPFYPFDPSIAHALPYFIWDSSFFWLIDLSVFILGFFMGLWAFSKKGGQADIVP